MATSRPYRPNLDYESGGTAPQYWVDAPVTASSALPTTPGQNYQTYTFSNQNTNFAPLGSIGGWQPLTEGTPSNATNVTYTATGISTQSQQAQQYYQTLHEAQMDMLRQYMRDVMLYGQATLKTCEPPKALKTQPLTAEERDELKRSLPF